MSEKGRFNAAITILELEEAKLSRGLGHPQISDEIKRNLTPMLFDYRAAIRVLEAAGKVDKAKLMVYLNHAIDWKENDSYGPGSAKEDRQLRALLESLPDGGKK
jgi:hypothetical protein